MTLQALLSVVIGTLILFAAIALWRNPDRVIAFLLKLRSPLARRFETDLVRRLYSDAFVRANAVFLALVGLYCIVAAVVVTLLAL